MGPFRVLARGAPNTYSLDTRYPSHVARAQGRASASPRRDVIPERLRRRPDRRGGGRRPDHLPPAGVLHPLPPARRGWCISQLPQPARRLLRPRFFLQVVWLACKTATAETAARDLVASVFRYVGLPRRARQTATCASPAPSQRACKRRSAHRPSSARRTLTKAPSKVERVNGAIADALRSAAGEPVDDWPALAQLVEFAQRLGLAPQALQSAAGYDALLDEHAGLPYPLAA